MKIYNVNMVITQIVETIFDVAVILYFANVGRNLSCIILPNGHAYSGEGYTLLLNLLLILYTIPLFMKLPRVSYTGMLVLVICVLTFCFLQIFNQKYENLRIFFTTPQSMF